MKNLLQNPKIKTMLVVLGAVIVLLLVFGLGLAVGYRKAMFASRWGANYFRNFFGAAHPGLLGMYDVDNLVQAPFAAHGAAGEVVDVASATLSVESPFGNEQSIVVLPGTVIRAFDGGASLDDIGAGEWVTVIGAPNGAGQIEARFIRVFPSSSPAGPTNNINY